MPQQTFAHTGIHNQVLAMMTVLTRVQTHMLSIYHSIVYAINMEKGEKKINQEGKK
jgi:hypothetical protein